MLSTVTSTTCATILQLQNHFPSVELSRTFKIPLESPKKISASELTQDQTTNRGPIKSYQCFARMEKPTCTFVC